MAEAASRVPGSWAIPSDLRANAPAARVSEFSSESRAAQDWEALQVGLDRCWTELDTMEARYDAFCALPDAARAAWLGWSIARTLHAVPAGKPGSALLDHLGRTLDIDVASWWRPTARAYFDRITKPNVLDLFEEIGGVELRSRHAASRKHDLAASAERLFAGDAIIEADRKERAMRWLPPEMRFGSETATGQDSSGDEAFAAPAEPSEASDIIIADAA
jgi:ParB family chromosome partitioning protein